MGLAVPSWYLFQLSAVPILNLPVRPALSTLVTNFEICFKRPSPVRPVDESCWFRYSASDPTVAAYIVDVYSLAYLKNSAVSVSKAGSLSALALNSVYLYHPQNIVFASPDAEDDFHASSFGGRKESTRYIAERSR